MGHAPQELRVFISWQLTLNYTAAYECASQGRVRFAIVGALAEFLNGTGVIRVRQVDNIRNGPTNFLY